ncbi:MAG: hypothetical protein LBV77_01595 [Candidatus Adiutrix intracellularis]|nr:hypothetical protein [Candidatus Adiutrix intracellularis]
MSVMVLSILRLLFLTAAIYEYLIRASCLVWDFIYNFAVEIGDFILDARPGFGLACSYSNFNPV